MALSLLHDTALAGIGEALGSQVMKEDSASEGRASTFHMSLLSGSHHQMLSSLGPLALHGPLLSAAPLLQWSAEQMALSRSAVVTNNNNNSSNKNKSSSKMKLSKDDEESSLSPPPSSIGDKVVGGNPRERQFVCRICNHSFGYKHVLQNHERTHTGEKPFECPECHKRFKRDHHLKTHIRLHTGEKPYHCPHCDRNFVQVANLRRHLRVHTGERPYACQLCSSKFSDSNQLKAHTLIHRGEKPFQCDCCQNRFRRRHHLTHHKCHQSPEEEIKKRERKPKEVRRLVRQPAHIYLPSATTSPTPTATTIIPSDLPEQTEPEDLSMSTAIKNIKNINNNNSISSATEDEEDLSDPWEDM